MKPEEFFALLKLRSDTFAAKLFYAAKLSKMNPDLYKRVRSEIEIDTDEMIKFIKENGP